MPTLDARISVGNIITLVGMLISAFWFFAETQKQIALQSVRIDHISSSLRDALQQEQATRREAINEMRVRFDADRAEIRQQLERLNRKLDELIKHGTQ